MYSGCSFLIIKQSTNKDPLKQPGDPEEVSIMLTPKKGLSLSKTSFITLCSKCTCVCLVTLSLELPFLLNPGQNLPLFTFNLTVN